VRVAIAGVLAADRAGADSSTVFFDIAAAQRLFGKRGVLDRIDLIVEPGARRALFTRLAPLVPRGAEAIDAVEQRAAVHTLRDAFTHDLDALAAIALLVAALLVANAGAIGVVLCVLVVAMAASAPFVFPRDPLGLAGRPLVWPGDNPRFWLGTDNSGRDIAAQIFHGARVALLIGLSATAIALVIGTTIGAVAGFYGGWIDDTLMRVTEAFQTLPNFLLLLVLVAVFGSDIRTVTIAIGIVSWPASARFASSPSAHSASRGDRPRAIASRVAASTVGSKL